MAPWPERPHKRFFSVAFPREHSRQALGRTLLRGVRFCAAAGTCSRTAPHISGRSQDGKALHLTGPPVLQRAARCAHGVAMDARLRPWQIWGSAGVNSPCAAAIIMAAARSRARSELWKTADEPSKMHAFYTSVTIRNFRRGNVVVTSAEIIPSRQRGQFASSYIRIGEFVPELPRNPNLCVTPSPESHVADH